MILKAFYKHTKNTKDLDLFKEGLKVCIEHGPKNKHVKQFLITLSWGKIKITKSILA